MATLYQLHSTMDTLRRSTEQMALTWRAGDSILLLGTTVAFIDWFNAYLGDIEEIEMEDIAGIYALAEDVAQLNQNTTAKLNLSAKLTGILSDNEWVAMTQDTNLDDAKFDKVITIAL
ncbi:hypothetical protein [Psychrobacter sp. DAB_AL43B]|uniref:hypothetical protein n=1 Tax=Psychrobacter sp. DAB_AL43B TaxID=1028416 RepID=UPI0009A89B8B|nr:hypothetical protein [Psychrobacter sp. DAB_AL43B]SLJ84859.1 dissimilatory sulfite reductase [Psychrobacter sp. DAB_AL43B]